ncbi:MAG: hypothetical protein WCI55_04705 [Armatimonadota bacterium]
MKPEEQTPAPQENKLGRLAFAYCKIATFSLLAGRFALPFAALLSAIFFIVSYKQGKKETKCYLRYPLIAASFWLLIVGAWVTIQFLPDIVPSWIKFIHH